MRGKRGTSVSSASSSALHIKTLSSSFGRNCGRAALAPASGRSGASPTGGASHLKKTADAAEQQRSDVKAAREAWFEGRRDLDRARLFFIDETSASTKMARFYWRAPKGERCLAAVPHGHWKTTTFTAGLRSGGLAAPFVLDGPINADAFRANVEQILVADLTPGDVAVMDNLPSHEAHGVRQAINTAGATLMSLSAYSPAFNPIEMAFSTFKTLPRAEAARTIPDLWEAIRIATDAARRV
jgi:transposase